MLSQEAIRLALWMRERWFCTVYDAARAMLPTGLWYVLKEGYALAPGVDRETWETATRDRPQANQLLQCIQAAGGRADLEQIKAIPDLKDPRRLLRELEKEGLVVKATNARRKVKDKTEPIACLAVDPAQALAQMAPRKKQPPMAYAVTELLSNLGSASVKELCYFTGASRQTVKNLEKRGILTLREQEVFRRPSPRPGSPAGVGPERAAAGGLRGAWRR